MDKILIEGLEANAVIGIHAWERKIRQRLIVDLELHLDLSTPGKSDRIADTISYGDIARQVTTFVEESSFFLIEALAEALADEIFREARISSLIIKVSKPGAVSNAANIAVILERIRQ